MPVVAQADSMRLLRCTLPFGEDLQGLRAGLDQAIPHASAKTAAVGEQVDRLEEAGLAGTVAAEDQVQARSGPQVGRLQVAQALDRQSSQAHSR